MDIHTSPAGWKVIGCAIEVHRELGPGLVESAYQRATAREFELRGLSFRQQVTLPGSYKSADIGKVYRVDFMVEGELVVEHANGLAGRRCRCGLAAGSLGAWALESVVRSTVFGWQSSGALAIACVAGAILFVAVIAALGPASRATRIDPAVSLRVE